MADIEQKSPLDGLYQDYFLDYASYVILERAIPAVEDGLKPVQRRILHSLYEIDDGRYHKVANVIGHSMKYHPHGDQAIGDALVKLGQKNLLIDTQGNWGDYRTGDSAAAPRYIEARLTKFALEVAFNKDITEYQLSYDGRNEEPLHLPMKFPLLLAQGVEGIAVGLSTTILPHNFIELIDASIKCLSDKPFKIYPDFPTGGLVDISEYNKGERGGKVKVRAKIEKIDKKTLAITELPSTQTTNQLIDSILKANSKGKINIKKITDNTAQEVEILIDLPSGVNPDVTIDALYAFTKCEDSISPNACVIVDNKPQFLDVHELLRLSTEHTKELSRQELLIEERDLLDKLHKASLEKIFIENRVYRNIEEAESWEQVIEIVTREMKKYIHTPEDGEYKDKTLLRLDRPFTEEDVHRLTEIKIRRISKYNKFKAQEYIDSLQAELVRVRHDLDHLVEYCIAYFERLKDKYGKGRERKTKIEGFDEIAVKQVVANNAKLYVDREEGFIGTSIKGGEFVSDCSDIDDIIVFLEDGTFNVSRIGEKNFVGKNIIHVDVWRKGDERTTYNLIYTDGKSNVTRAKRFNVKSITREKAYNVTSEAPKSRLLYFTANPNGEAEVVEVLLSPSSKARKKKFDFDFAEMDIKGRSSQGNIVTKYPVRKVSFKSAGESTIGRIEVYYDKNTGEFNKDGQGSLLGKADDQDHYLILHSSGEYEVQEVDLTFTKKLKADEVSEVVKLEPTTVVTAVHYDSDKKWTLVKRFQIDTSTSDQRFLYINDARGSKLLYSTTNPNTTLSYKAFGKEHEALLDEVVDIKGWKAMGNKLSDGKITHVKVLSQGSQETSEQTPSTDSQKLKVGDSIEFDLEDDKNQPSLFEDSDE